MAQLVRSIKKSVILAIFRNAWTNDEDLYLFNAVDGMGKKWA
jgi:hypothetical protein